MAGRKGSSPAGDLRAANIVLLGAVSRKLDISEAIWMQALKKMAPKKALEINRQAFSMGRSLN